MSARYRFSVVPDPRECVRRERQQNSVIVNVAGTPDRFRVKCRCIRHFGRVHLTLNFRPLLTRRLRRRLPLFRHFVSGASCIKRVKLSFSHRNIMARRVRVGDLREVLTVMSNGGGVVDIRSHGTRRRLLSLLGGCRVGGIVFR